MKRHSPHRNTPAAELIDFLDAHAILDVDIDGVQRGYINGVWIDSLHKREIRRYRNGQVRSIRPESLSKILEFFNLEASWQQARQLPAAPRSKP